MKARLIGQDSVTNLSSSLKRFYQNILIYSCIYIGLTIKKINYDFSIKESNNLCFIKERKKTT